MVIKIGAEPASHFKGVSDLLYEIQKNRVGAVFVNKIHEDTKLNVRIYPMDAGRAAREGADNAITSPWKPKDSAPKGVSAVKEPYWYRGNPDHPATREDERYDMVPKGYVGTGKGSNALIYFSIENIKAKKVFDRGPDSVLLHELVHAYRIFQGLRNPVPTENSKWKDEEEWLAVIITNVYLSAAGSTRLRGGYGDYDQRLEPPEDTSAGFLTPENVKLIQKLWPFWAPVFSELAFVTNARFNPFREYVMPRLWTGKH